MIHDQRTELNHGPDDLLHDLLADRASVGLRADEQHELQRILSSEASAEDQDDWSWDLAAASMHLAFIKNEDLDVIPVALAKKIKVGSAESESIQRTDDDRDVIGRVDPGSQAAQRNGFLPVWAPWLVAAACLAIAVLAQIPWFFPEPQPTLAEQLQALVENENDTLSYPWAAGSDIAEVSGEVIWNNRLQRGFMRVQGLAVHAAGNEVYQLWIVDGGRPDQPPVDGGVFDVDVATGDIIIPINAKLPIRQPTVFAVTEETDPMGVVISEKGKKADFVIVAPTS